MLINPHILDSVVSEFIISVDTTKAGSASDTFVLPLQNDTTNMTVYWGDGNSDVITAWNQAELTHVYSSSGTYQITCDGSFGGVNNQLALDKLKFISIDNWGTNAFTKMSYSFNGCANMVLNATDEPNFSGVLSLQAFMAGCTSLNTEINWTTTNNVTNFRSAFQGCTVLNSAITLNTDSASDFYQMFYGCSVLNSAITFSDTSGVTSMFQMFYSCTAFNQPLTFDCTASISMYRMFIFCTAFNSTLTFTNTGAVTDMFQVFYGCTVFDQDISSWDISSITRATGMMQNTAFGTTNYDLLLVAWEGQTEPTGIVFHAGTAKYSAGAPATARGVLVGTSTWTITDGGPV
jgi:hypothetical protein